MSSYNLDLALSDLDFNDDKKLADTIEQWYKRDYTSKWDRAQTWSQNIHFLSGNQWIRYNTQERKWETYPITQRNQHIDRPTTNHLNRWVRQHVSGYTNRPELSIEPNSEEPEDKTAAKVGEIIMSYSWEEQHKMDQYYECALWSMICGLGIKKSFKKFTKFIIDETKMKINDSMPVSPFCISFDGIPSRFRDIGIVMESDVQRIQTVKDEFGKTGDGYTGRVNDLKEEKLVSSVLALKEGLKDIVSGSQGYQNVRPEGEALKDSLVKKEVYVRPSSKYPKGRMVVVASGEVLYKGDSPYYYQDGHFWHPYTFVNYEKVPGNLWGNDFVQRLVPIQRRINSIDALIAYNRKTIAVPWILNPLDSGIKPGEKVGIPGQQIDYEPSPTGVRPEIVPGTALPNQVMEERNMLIQDGDLISMAGDIRSGKNPKGVKTVGQLQILSEQSEMARARQIEDWEKFVEESEKLDLLNFQDCYQAPIEQINKKIKRFSKDLTSFDWDAFTGSELKDNATVRIEKGSTLAKSRLARQGLILDMARNGFLGDLFSDPYKYKNFLAEFGLSSMFTDENVDVTMAEKVIEMMLEGQSPPMLEQYNPDIHMVVLARYMKQPKFLELEPENRMLFMNRYRMLVDQLSQYPTVADNGEAVEGGQDESKMPLQEQAV